MIYTYIFGTSRTGFDALTSADFSAPWVTRFTNLRMSSGSGYWYLELQRTHEAARSAFQLDFGSRDSD